MRLVKAPLGLLELFRLRDLGQNPDEFEDRVQATADVRDFYGADLLVTETIDGAPAAIGTGVSLPVSTTTRRYIGASGNIVLGAAAGTSLNIAIGAAYGASATIALASMQIVTPVAAQVYRIAADLRDGLVLPPGWSINLLVNGNAGGADHVAQLRTFYQQLDGRN